MKYLLLILIICTSFNIRMGRYFVCSAQTINDGTTHIVYIKVVEAKDFKSAGIKFKKWVATYKDNHIINWNLPGGFVEWEITENSILK